MYKASRCVPLAADEDKSGAKQLGPTAQELFPNNVRLFFFFFLFLNLFKSLRVHLN